MAPKSPRKSTVSPKKVSDAIDVDQSVESAAPESILLTLPFECLSTVFYRYLEDEADLFDRARALDRLRSVCKLFAEVGSTVDQAVRVYAGISKVRDALPLLKDEREQCGRVLVCAVKTLNHGATIKREDSTAKALPEKPRRLRDIFALLSLFPNLQRIDLRVNGKRGTVEVSDLMKPLKELPCLESLRTLAIDFPRAWDWHDEWQMLYPRKEWASMDEMLPRLGQLKTLKMKTLGMTTAVIAEEAGELPACQIKTLEADNISNAFAAWLNGSSDMSIKLDDGCLSSNEVVFRCSAAIDMTLARIDANPQTRVSLPNLVSLRATNGFEFFANASDTCFSDMPMLQHLTLPVAPSRAYSRTRANTRAAKIHEEVIKFIRERQPPLLTLVMVIENWDRENIANLEEACLQSGTLLSWRSLYNKS